MEVINKVFQYKNKQHLLKKHIPQEVDVEEPPPIVDEVQVREVYKAK